MTKCLVSHPGGIGISAIVKVCHSNSIKIIVLCHLQLHETTKY